MSDRCVFAGFVHPVYGTDYTWADVVVPVNASVDEIHAAASDFAGLPGPHKVLVASREDYRFVEFRRYLEEKYVMVEGHSYWGYSVAVGEGGA